MRLRDDEAPLSGADWDATVLSKEDSFIGTLGEPKIERNTILSSLNASFLYLSDLEFFRRDIDDLGKKLAAQQGPADLAHLNKIIFWRCEAPSSSFVTLLITARVSRPCLPVDFARGSGHSHAGS